MQLKLNKKGFTLVEIVVVLLISAILMATTAGILINALGYFDDTLYQNSDKVAAEGILDYIGSEIKYCTDVKVLGRDYPTGDEWSYLSIKNNKLYKNDIAVFDDAYYDSRKLVINVKGYGNNDYRLDINIDYLDDNQSVYNTSRTFELLNMQVKYDGLTSNIYSSGEGKIDENLRIYYSNTDSITASTDDSVVLTGTVLDKLYLMTDHLNKGYFTSNNNYTLAGIYDTCLYNLDDYVFYQGYWYLRVVDNSSCPTPGENNSPGWQRLDDKYVVGKPSSYVKDDIVSYNNKYYKCKVDYLIWGSNCASTDAPDKMTDRWEEVLNENVSSNNYSLTYGNVAVTTSSPMSLLPTEYKGYDTDYKNTAEWASNGSYKKNDYVKLQVYDGSSGGDKFYYLYKKIFETTDNIKPGTSAYSGWELISNNYNAGSSYLAGTEIFKAEYSGASGEFKEYYKCNYDLINESNRKDLIAAINAIIPDSNNNERVDPNNNSTNNNKTLLNYICIDVDNYSGDAKVKVVWTKVSLS